MGSSAGDDDDDDDDDDGLVVEEGCCLVWLSSTSSNDGVPCRRSVSFEFEVIVMFWEDHGSLCMVRESSRTKAHPRSSRKPTARETAITAN
ncbi:expressed unknown protein [Seminavis robusta]|uniref:Uncharacterized protein n=1 Tax=Seminavis robusta TaxID=568900 RepID=A0A9N8DJT8_9STRA|nr:expressed unknown protein [Seminavis robusta]|eukprot:Sro197_g083900.1 n/a (91) ;mRNA; r:83347-83619